MLPTRPVGHHVDAPERPTAETCSRPVAISHGPLEPPQEAVQRLVPLPPRQDVEAQTSKETRHFSILPPCELRASLPVLGVPLGCPVVARARAPMPEAAMRIDHDSLLVQTQVWGASGEAETTVTVPRPIPAMDTTVNPWAKSQGPYSLAKRSLRPTVAYRGRRPSSSSRASMSTAWCQGIDG